jgi:hypothetical protein
MNSWKCERFWQFGSFALLISFVLSSFQLISTFPFWLDQAEMKENHDAERATHSAWKMGKKGFWFLSLCSLLAGLGTWYGNLAFPSHSLPWPFRLESGQSLLSVCFSKWIRTSEHESELHNPHHVLALSNNLFRNFLCTPTARQYISQIPIWTRRKQLFHIAIKQTMPMADTSNVTNISALIKSSTLLPFQATTKHFSRGAKTFFPMET